MKSIRSVILMVLIITHASLTCHAQLGIVGIVNTVAKKVIRQIDLRVQKKQNETIALQNAQKALENAMTKAKLEEIAGWMEKQKRLYETYYNELWKVKTGISTYYRVRQIAAQHQLLLSEYNKAYRALSNDPNFSRAELAHLFRVYQAIIKESAQNIEQLTIVATSFSTRMTDGQRLKLIAAIADEMQQHFDAFKTFNAQNHLLRLQRAKERAGIESIGRMYGIKIVKP